MNDSRSCIIFLARTLKEFRRYEQMETCPGGKLKFCATKMRQSARFIDKIMTRGNPGVVSVMKKCAKISLQY